MWMTAAGQMPSRADSTAEFFRAIKGQFSAASNAAGIVDHAVKVGGQIFRLEFAGPALVDRIVPALSHHLITADPNGNSPDLTIRIWDAASTGIGAPAMPWNHDQFASRREVSGTNGGGYRAAYDLYCGVLSIVSIKDNCAYWWIGDSEKLPLYESAAPLREILQAWFDHKGGIFVHAAAIGNEDGAVLLVGKGGSGKTTTAIACADTDLRLLGEDYCLVTGFGQPQAHAHSLYCSAKLTDHSLDLLPHLKPLVINDDRKDRDGKAIVMFGQHFPMLSHAPVKAIVLPTRTDSDRMKLIAASPTDALMALAPSTILQLSGQAQSALGHMKQLVEKIPAYRLELGKRPRDAAEHLRRLVTGRS